MTDDKTRQYITDKLDSGLTQSLTGQEISYRPFPYEDGYGSKTSSSVWRIQFELASDPSQRFGLDANDDIVLGRSGPEENRLDLSMFDAVNLGVSRKHALLRPTSTALYLVDLGSTNGTYRNGQSIGVNTPYSLVNGDSITLGKLQLTLRIVGRPRTRPDFLDTGADLAEAMTLVAKAITSQHDLDEVLTQVVETARSLTSAEEASIWLMEQDSGELYLEAERGLGDTGVRRERVASDDDSLVGKVMKQGRPIRATREPGEESIGGVADRVLESVVYTPLVLGGVTVGVLVAGHRAAGASFSERDERLLSAIADFAAIAIVNARLMARLEHERATVHATVSALSQPFMMLDDAGRVLLSNDAAKYILDNHRDEFFGSIQNSDSPTLEIKLGDSVYLSTIERAEGVGAIIVMQDITYVVELEQERSEFIRTLSHDMKSPLTSIKGWAHLVTRMTKAEGKAAEYLAQIEGSVDRMTDMIRHLVQSLTMTEGVQIARRPVDLVEVFGRAVRDLDGAALNKQIVLGYQVYGEARALTGDEQRLYHMALNLIDNAIKYSPEGTQVDVTLEFEDELILLTVADQGKGIPPDELKQVFDKYFRGSGAHTGEFGVGLGLSVVQAAATLHGGTVTVHNRDGGGSVFTVAMPAVYLKE